MSSHELSMGHLRSPSVSLLAEATSAASNSGNTIEEKLGKINIYKSLTKYEDALAKLIDSVDKFNPNIEFANDLIHTDHDLFTDLKTFKKYDEIDAKLHQLEDESSAIDKHTRKILETLNECHDDLNKLPILEQVEFERDTILSQRAKVNSTVLLDYATKLSKFTKIPPTFDKGSIGPNNFVWPGDDALRRGMLAMASLNSEQLTGAAGQRIPDNLPKDTADTATKDTSTIDEEESKHIEEGEDTVRDLYVFNGKSDKSDEEKKEQSDNDEDVDLDLDLFNPDEF